MACDLVSRITDVHCIDQNDDTIYYVFSQLETINHMFLSNAVTNLDILKIIGPSNTWFSWFGVATPQAQCAHSHDQHGSI